MLGKKFIYKRSVMIALTIFALMTLTAGVAAAASMKAKDVTAAGFVTGLDIPDGTTIKSKFKFHKGTETIKSVDISTKGEVIDVAGLFFGQDNFVMTGCEPVGSDACAAADAVLYTGSTRSVHNSKVKLTVADTVVFEEDYFFQGSPEVTGIAGYLKGSLNAKLTLTPLSGDPLTGSAKLKINSTVIEGVTLPSVYICMGPVQLAPGFFMTIPIDVENCIAAKGKTVLDEDPVMVPLSLEVVDTGKFNVKNSSVKFKGELEVVIGALAGPTGGAVAITNGEMKFTGK